MGRRHDQLTLEERHALFHDNAVRIYRLEQAATAD